MQYDSLVDPRNLIHENFNWEITTINFLPHKYPAIWYKLYQDLEYIMYVGGIAFICVAWYSYGYLTQLYSTYRQPKCDNVC